MVQIDMVYQILPFLFLYIISKRIYLMAKNKKTQG